MSGSAVDNLTNGLYSAPIIIGSSLTLVSAAILIGTYRHYEELRRHPNGLVYWKSVLDVIFAATLIVEAGLRLGGRGSAVQCAAVAFFVEFSLLGSEFCFLMLSVDLFTAMRDPFVDYKSNMRKYLAATIVAAGALAGALVGPGLYGLTDFGTCWVQPGQPPLLFAFFVSYLLAIFALSFFVLVYARRRLAKGLRDTYEARMLSFRHGLAFVAGYAAFWLIVGGVYGWSLTSATAPTLSPVAWAFCLLFTSRGVPTLVVWLANHDLRAVEQSEKAARFRYGGTLGRVNRQLQPHLNLALRKEVLHYSTLAIRMSVMHAAGEASVLRVLASVKQHLQERRSAEAAAAAAASAAAESARNRRTTFIRRVSTVFGVGPGAGGGAGRSARTLQPSTTSATQRAHLHERENPLFLPAQQAATRRGSGIGGARLLPLAEPDDGTVPAALTALLSPYNDPRPEAALGFEWKPLDIALNAHLFERGGLLDFGEFLASSSPPRQKQHQKGGGSSSGVGDAEGGGSGAGAAADLEQVAPTPTSAYDGVIRRPPLELQDLAPDVFARIRHTFGISPAQFLYSLSRTTKETFSEGASGAFMKRHYPPHRRRCFSYDMRFVMKTMERDEAAVLQRMLPAYLDYVRRNRDTLIIRFFACMSLRLYRHTLYFVVMENVFPTKASIHERFDLKGSWVGRSGSKGTPGTVMKCRFCSETFRVGSAQYCPARPNRRHAPNTVLKDNDLNFRLRLSAAHGVQLKEQLRADVAFLAAQGVMDYSLLVGVHNRKFRIEREDSVAPALQQQQQLPSSPPSQLPATQWVTAMGLSAPTQPAVVPTLLPQQQQQQQLRPALKPFLQATLQGPGGGARGVVFEEEDDFSESESGTPLSRRRDPPWSRGGAVTPTAAPSWLPGSSALGGYNAPPFLTAATSRPAARPQNVPVRPPSGQGVLASPEGQGQGLLLQQGGGGRGPYVPFFRGGLEGGLAAAVVEGPGIYHLGLIDILQEWSFSKRAERWLKSALLCQDKHGISVMPPREYAERFQKRVIAQLVEGDAAAAGERAAHGHAAVGGVPALRATRVSAAAAAQR